MKPQGVVGEGKHAETRDLWKRREGPTSGRTGREEGTWKDSAERAQRRRSCREINKKPSRTLAAGQKKKASWTETGGAASDAILAKRWS